MSLPKPPHRLCDCDLVEFGTLYTPDQCRACWLFHHVPRLNISQGGDGQTHPVPTDRPAVAASAAKKPLVGTALQQILTWFGHAPAEKCKCQSRAAFLNGRSVTWCRKNRAKIAGWLVEEAEKAGVMFAAAAAAVAVELAIVKAEISFWRGG